MTRHIGDIRIDRVIEMEGPDFVAHELIPDATPEALAPHKDWLHPHYVDFATMKLVMAMQTYVLRHGEQRHSRRHLRRQSQGAPLPAPHGTSAPSTTWLDNLATAGVRLEDVTHVMCTHLHIDHVGWNTQLIDGRWVPTFPNARYVFAQTEWEYFDRPLQEARRQGRRRLVRRQRLADRRGGTRGSGDKRLRLDAGLWFEPYPGHTPGHVAINLLSKGKRGVC